MPLEKISRTAFNLIHGKNLVYNQCWEDPRLDRVALDLSPEDKLLVITSAGCNALDYSLAGTGHVYAVDMNFRQNAVLELKKAALQTLEQKQFFELFGTGKLKNWGTLYPKLLRPALPTDAQGFWDQNGDFFAGKGRRNSYYFRGTSGLFAFMANTYINRFAKLRPIVDELLNAKTVEEQKEIFEKHKLMDRLFRPLLRWALRRDTTMALLGVPRSQRQQMDREYPGGVAQFIMDSIETVFSKLPLHDNYFWRVYLTGEYTPECCPEYLKAENFETLKNTVADKVSTHTDSALGFLEKHPEKISRFVLLDHMDWLYAKYKDVLIAEWQGIVDRAASNTKIIFRSASPKVDFVDPIEVKINGKKTRLGELLHYNTELAEELHQIDRVHTYASFYIADLKI